MVNKHDPEVEARLFSADIESLKNHYPEFKKAWDNDQEATIEVKLMELADICPRKYIRTLQYRRLTAYLETKKITLIVKSQKNKLSYFVKLFKNVGRIIELLRSKNFFRMTNVVSSLLYILFI